MGYQTATGNGVDIPRRRWGSPTLLKNLRRGFSPSVILPLQPNKALMNVLPFQLRLCYEENVTWKKGTESSKLFAKHLV